MHRGVLVAAAGAAIGAFVTWRWLPARAVDEVDAAAGAATADAVSRDGDPALAEA
jgi:hypothetical protein